MARSYHLAAARLAIECDAKWLDNLLSLHSLPGVTSERRGVARRLSAGGVLHAALVHQLVSDLGLAVRDAVSIAIRLLVTPGGRILLPGGTALEVDVATLEHRVEARLADAAEVELPPRRGRPPKRPHDRDVPHG